MTPRRLAPDELPALVTAANRVFRPGDGDRDMGRSYPLLFDTSAEACLFVVEEKGHILSHAGFVLRQGVLQGRRTKVACFGAIFTSAEHRGQGLASRCFERAVEGALALGAALGIISGDRALYRRHGFEGAPAALRVRIPAAHGAPSRLATANDAAALVRLHQAEPVRLERSAGVWSRLVQARVALWSPGAVHVVAGAQGAVVAYLAVEDAPRITPEGPVLRAIEVGGDRTAAGRAAAELAALRGWPDAELLGSAHDQALLDAATAHGWVSTPARFPFAVARWATIPDALVPWLGLDYV